MNSEPFSGPDVAPTPACAGPTCTMSSFGAPGRKSRGYQTADRPRGEAQLPTTRSDERVRVDPGVGSLVRSPQPVDRRQVRLYGSPAVRTRCRFIVPPTPILEEKIHHTPRLEDQVLALD